jgi:hypothetical protein
MLKSLLMSLGAPTWFQWASDDTLDNAVQKPVYLPSVPATRRTFCAEILIATQLFCQPSCNELVVGQQFCIIVRSCWLLIATSTQPPTRPELIVILIYKKDVKPIAIQYWYCQAALFATFSPSLTDLLRTDTTANPPPPPPVSFSAHGCFCNFWSVSCWWNHLQIVGASEHELSLRDHQWVARSQGGGLLLQCVGWVFSTLD